MKGRKSIKTVSAVLIAVLLLLSLCSCGNKEAGETTTSAEATVSTAAFSETTSIPESTEAPQTTAQAVTQQAATKPQPQTQAQHEEAEVSGTESMTDGNKTVVYPLAVKSSQRSFPVIVWANGTGAPTQSYMSLIEKLAEGGYIVVSDASVMTADGTAQIDSVNYILSKNGDAQSFFYNKVNTAAIGACGHSQGGRSSVNAAQKDSRIRCVVSIAGASSADEARGLGTPCLFLTGTSDLVVISSQWCKPSYDAVSGRAAYASLKGGIHTTCMTNPEKVSGYTLDWFNAYLLGNAQARSVFENGGKMSADSAWQDFQNKN
ncbi:MAG: hypothetical protein IJL63_08390 [Clostridia bacterium]|nr:hypothetical protein [Clostridia bacterium]